MSQGMGVGRERLWTPWRMRYIGGHAKEDGCIFCNRLNANDDVESLILHRGDHCFAIMNLFPYNTGHIMIVPNQHVDDPSQLDAATLHEMADLLPIATRALRRDLNCQGFNVGLNIGAVAGAGIAEHLHQHIVPRWQGDANFMPILGSTMVIPEVIPSTYAKVRAELRREMSGDVAVTIVVLLDDDHRVLLVEGKLPVFTAESGQPLWSTALGGVPEGITDLEVTGWAGANRADPKSTALAGAGLVVRGRIADSGTIPEAVDLAPLDDRTMAGLDAGDRAYVERGLDQLAPIIIPPSSNPGSDQR